LDLFRLFVVVVLIGIVGSLGSALFHLTSNRDNSPESSRRMARALTVRVGLSVGLFVLLLFAWSQGWIQPHRIGAR
jgi:cytochrome bd-type quinol oxidase subunit 2